MGLRGIPETAIRFEDMDVPRLVLVTAGGLKKWLRRPDERLQQPARRRRDGGARHRPGRFELALDFGERHQFGRPINEFQGLQWKLADMSIKLPRRGAVYGPPQRRSFPDMLLAAQAKVFTSENASRWSTTPCSFRRARLLARLPLERMARDARMFTIGGGTAEVLRNSSPARCSRRSCRRHATATWSANSATPVARAAPA